MRSRTILFQSVITSLFFTAFLACNAFERSQSLRVSQNAVKAKPSPLPTVCAPVGSAACNPSPTFTPTPTPTPISFPVNGAPIVLYTDIIAGPNTGGENNSGAYLSIFGKNFGNNLNQLKVTIGDGEVARYIYLGSSLGRPDVQQLSVQLGPRAVTGAIKVELNQLASNTNLNFTVRPGNFYYISKTGSDSTGAVNDITRPYRTPNAVWSLTALAPGDFIIIRGGNYDISANGGATENLYMSRWMNAGIGRGRSSGNGPFNVINGTDKEHAIAVQGYPSEFPVIDWGSDTTGSLRGIQVIGPGRNYVFSDLVFDLKESGGNALLLGFFNFTGDDNYCFGCRLVNMRVQHGMNANQSTGGVNPISLMRVDDLVMYGVDVGNQSPNANPLLESHVVYMSHWYTNADLGWNYIHDNAYGRAALQVAGDYWGSQPYGPGTTWGQNTNVKIHDNLMSNLPHECMLFGMGSFGIDIYNNVISNCQRRQDPGFSPIAFRGASDPYVKTPKGVYRFFNNTVYTSAPGGGIFQFGYDIGGSYELPEHITLWNNVIAADRPSTSFFQITDTVNDLDFNPATQITSNNNIWWGSSDPLPPFSGAYDRKIDPQLVGAPSDFRLLPGSPAIGAGSPAVNPFLLWDYDFNPRPTGLTPPDIGAFQYR